MTHHDVIVIGAGNAGLTAALPDALVMTTVGTTITPAHKASVSGTLTIPLPSRGDNFARAH
jgi:thioredoxin reductase